MAIIIFLNEEESTVTVLKDNKVHVLPWTSMYEIASLINGQEVYYVTSADLVNGQEVLSLLCSITGLKNDPVGFSKTQTMYIRSVSNSKLLCRTDSGEILFDGPSDIKSIDSLPAGVLESSDNIRKCLAAGKLEIIDEIKRKQIISAEKNRKKNKSPRDQAIDSILIKSSVDSFFKEEKSSDDIISIDIDAD